MNGKGHQYVSTHNHTEQCFPADAQVCHALNTPLAVNCCTVGGVKIGGCMETIFMQAGQKMGAPFVVTENFSRRTAPHKKKLSRSATTHIKI